MSKVWNVLGSAVYHHQVDQYCHSYEYVVACYTTKEQAEKHAELAEMFDAQYHHQQGAIINRPANPYDPKWLSSLRGHPVWNWKPYRIAYSVREAENIPIYRHVDEYLEANEQ